jgi:nucleotide-binding universal stress UspA family protein
MFGKILHANDGSEHAFHALSLALAVAKQNNSELHMISVEEIDGLHRRSQGRDGNRRAPISLRPAARPRHGARA